MRLIDADELIRKGTSTFDESIPIADFIEMVELRPTIEAEPIRHGKWKYDYSMGMNYCSECGWGMVKGERRYYNYCPNCGARMDDNAPSEEAYDDFYAKQRD